jgi:hypothetical protein
MLCAANKQHFFDAPACSDMKFRDKFLSGLITLAALTALSFSEPHGFPSDNRRESVYAQPGGKSVNAFCHDS